MDELQDDPPELTAVSTFEEREPLSGGGDSLNRWWLPLSEETTGHDYFDLGFGFVQPGERTTVYPPNTEYEFGEMETASIVLEGRMQVEHPNGTTEVLDERDCLFLPPETDCTIRNVGDEELRHGWIAAAPHEHNTLDLTDEQRANRPDGPEVIRTLEEIEPSFQSSPGHTKRYWVAISPDTVGAKHFTFGYMTRPAGSKVPLHYHEHQPEITEGYMVVNDHDMLVGDGVNDPLRLSKYDTVFIPPYGQHYNKNVGDGWLDYLFVESPPRTAEQIEAEEEDKHQ